MNEAWHRKHPLGRNASTADRARWHTAHAKACGCRPIPPSLLAKIRAE